MEYFRGDIVFVEKSKYIGKECGGDRPAVIVSNNSGNHFSDCVEIVYLTTAKKKDLPTHVNVMCRVHATALCEQIYTVSKERITQFIRTCTEEEMQKIDDALMVSLGLNKETPTENKHETKVDFEHDNSDAESEKQIQESIDPVKVGELITSLAKTTAERDVYEKLYKDLLEKVTS